MILKTIPYLKGTKDYSAINLNQLKIVGALIHEARQQQNISIEALSEDLRINKEKLVAIESAQLDLLPERVLIIGMTKRIAERLKLSSDDLISKLKDNPSQENEELPTQIEKSIYQNVVDFIKISKDVLMNFLYKQTSKDRNGLINISESNKPIDNWEEKVIAVELKAKEAKRKWEEKKAAQSLTLKKENEVTQDIKSIDDLEKPIKTNGKEDLKANPDLKGSIEEEENSQGIETNPDLKGSIEEEENSQGIETNAGLKDSIEEENSQDIKTNADLKDSIEEENNNNESSLKTLIVSGGQVIEKIFTQPNGENISVKKKD
ncbi:helix-turn-helix domain-containing protein [Prochlorococcus marinus]|uniref:Uncharacterized protein n=1 Tax=Prochlorococcus marinus (strain MIT 9211) TaxID=93059 RepID=A9BC20_PROM4|nr:helix-turn-helix transcriptional regulator [Prochlorococcus marinus]ABX09382.1 Hypothetical protein P9211_14511 [Prochlorococcus marinus str. MIT 9211]